MKVKELIAKLQEYDGELDIMADCITKDWRIERRDGDRVRREVMEERKREWMGEGFGGRRGRSWGS